MPQPASRATLVNAIVFDEFALPMTTTASAVRAMRVERELAVRRRETQVVARRRPYVGELRAGLVDDVGPFVLRECRLGEHRDVFGIAHVGGGAAQIVDVFDEPNRVGRDGNRADRFVVPRVADIENRVSLAGPHLRFVVDLGDERAHRVDHVAAVGARGVDDLGWGAVGGKHQGCARRDGGHVVDEHDTLLTEAVDDDPVVDDLVVAVHGRFEGTNHPREGLDRHLHAGTEAARFGQEDLLDGHENEATGPLPVLLIDARRPRCLRRARFVRIASGRCRGRRGRRGER